MAKVTIEFNVCKGCGLCVNACPKKIIELSKDKLNAKGHSPAEVVDENSCIGCACCAIMCPDCAITVEK